MKKYVRSVIFCMVTNGIKSVTPVNLEGLTKKLYRLCERNPRADMDKIRP